MYRRSILMLLALLAFTFYPFGNVFAEQSTPVVVTSTEGFGILTNNETGESFNIPVTVTNQNLGNDKYVTEYFAEISSSILGGKENWDEDPTYSARLYIYMSYRSKFVGGNKYAKVDYYKGKWMRLDPAVNCTKLEIKARCIGDSEPGSPNHPCRTPQERISTKQTPTSGTYYQYTPPWAGVYIYISDVTGHLGTTKAFLTRSGTSWTFEIGICEGGSWGIC